MKKVILWVVLVLLVGTTGCRKKIVNEDKFVQTIAQYVQKEAQGYHDDEIVSYTVCKVYDSISLGDGNYSVCCWVYNEVCSKETGGVYTGFNAPVSYQFHVADGVYSITGYQTPKDGNGNYDRQMISIFGEELAKKMSKADSDGTLESLKQQLEQLKN